MNRWDDGWNDVRGGLRKRGFVLAVVVVVNADEER